MKERIQRLLVETGVINNNFNPLAYEQWYLDSLEKFAELIVKECVDIVDDEGCGEGGSIRAMKKIKQHFGVEE